MDASRKAVILNMGREPSFQRLRNKLLTDAGYAVISAESVAEARAALGSRQVMALVVGAWVPKVERDELVHLVKENNRHTAIIFYYDQNIEGTEAADAILNFRGDHSDLVRTVQHLLAKSTQAGGKLRYLAAFILSLGSTWLSGGWSASLEVAEILR